MKLKRKGLRAKLHSGSWWGSIMTDISECGIKIGVLRLTGELYTLRLFFSSFISAARHCSYNLRWREWELEATHASPDTFKKKRCAFTETVKGVNYHDWGFFKRSTSILPGIPEDNLCNLTCLKLCNITVREKMESHAAVQGFRDWLQGRLLRAITHIEVHNNMSKQKHLLSE